MLPLFFPRVVRVSVIASINTIVSTIISTPTSKRRSFLNSSFDSSVCLEIQSLHQPIEIIVPSLQN